MYKWDLSLSVEWAYSRHRVTSRSHGGSLATGFNTWNRVGSVGYGIQIQLELCVLEFQWDQLDMVYKSNWNFSNLEHAFEEGGELYDEKVYIYGCLEIQLVEENITVFSVMIAVVSPVPPSDKIGMRSSYKEPEEIVPMKQLKMDWVPYSPLEQRVWPREAQIFILSFTSRRDALERMKLEQWEKLKYCLPCLEWSLREDDIEECREVEIHYPLSNKPHQVTILFHWKSEILRILWKRKFEKLRRFIIRQWRAVSRTWTRLSET